MDTKILIWVTLIITTVSSKELPKFFCGAELSEALTRICNHRMFQKRSITLSDGNTEDWALTSRAARNVIEICCADPCSMEELLSYCKDIQPIDREVKRGEKG